MTTAREALEESGMLDDTFSFELAEHIKADMESGKGKWGWDPDVDGVVGFQITTESGKQQVVVIAWLEARDFEADSRYADGVEL